MYGECFAQKRPYAKLAEGYYTVKALVEMGRKGSLPVSAEQVKERIFDPWGFPNNDFPIKQKQFCVNVTHYQLGCQDFSREIESTE